MKDEDGDEDEDEGSSWLQALQHSSAVLDFYQ